MPHPLHEPGNYFGRVVSQEFGDNKNGNLQLRLNMALDAAETDIISVFIIFTEKTMEFATGNLMTLGYAKSSLRFLDPGVEGHHSFEGATVELYCKHDQYEGSTREKWQIAAKGSMKPAAPDKVRKLDALFGAQVKAQGGPRRTLAPVEPAPTKHTHANGDGPQTDPNAAFAESAVDGDGVPF